MYLNKVQIIGNLTRDPELRALPSGANVANFAIATNRTWKDKDGSKKEEVEFHNIVVFGKMAETTATYMKKGSQIYIEGRIQTRTWDKDGEKKYRTEIVAENIQFGNKPRGDGSERPVARREEPVGGIEYGTDDINPDDIPF